MKKILTTLAASGLCAGAFAQGVVNWTGAAGYIIAETNATVYSSFEASSGTPAGGTVGNTAPGNTYYYELLVSSSATAPTTDAGLSSWLDTGLGAQNGASANGRILQNNSSTAAVANNLPAGSTLNDILVGWSANLGATWAIASGNLASWATAQANVSGTAFFGVSGVGSIQGIASPGPGNQAFGTGAGQILNQSPNQLQLDALSTTTVPEPGTLALAALGGASLLMFRRKK
jgi:hypothetical protein